MHGGGGNRNFNRNFPMRHFNLSRDYNVRLLNETITGCEGQDIRNWKPEERGAPTEIS